MNKFLYSLFAFFIGIVGLSSCTDDNGETPEQYYTVEFNSMGGSEVKPQEVKSGELVVKPENPTKTGEVFVAWYASDKFDREWNFAEDVVDSDITLFAMWEKQESEDTMVQRLRELIVKAESVSKTDHSEDSYELLQRALVVAKEVVANAGASIEKQIKAYDALEEALYWLFPSSTYKAYTIELGGPHLHAGEYVINNNKGGFLDVYFSIYDIEHHLCEGKEGEIKIDYDKEKLKTWSIKGEIDENNRSIIIYDLKNNLTVGEEIVVEATSVAHPEMSAKVKIKVYDDDEINRQYIERINECCDIRNVNFDTYLEHAEKWTSINAFSQALIRPFDDINVKNAQERAFNFYKLFSFWDKNDVIHMKDDFYVYDWDGLTMMFKYISSGDDFPCGEFVAEWGISYSGCQQNKYVFNSNGEFAAYIRDWDTGKEPEDWRKLWYGEYKYVKTTNNNGYIIIHQLGNNHGSSIL